MRRPAIVALLLGVSSIALAACGSGDPLATSTTNASSAGPTVVVGSANFPENQLLAEIYAQALEAKGTKVTRKFNIGAREAYVAALKSGEITVFPEYTGNFDKYLNPKTTATDAPGILADLKASLPASLALLEPASAEDKDSVTVTKATADKYNLKTIADLAPVAKDLVLAGPAEWKTRDTGVPGLKRVYGLEFKEFKPFDSSGTLLVEALKNGQADAVNLYTTDPNIAANGFVSLEDPKNFFVPQQVVPVVGKDVAAKLAPTLNAVSAKLDTPTLADMVKQVVLDKADVAKVAKEFLAKNALS